MVLIGVVTEEGEPHRKALSGDIQAIKEAGDNHPFINAMVNSIPEQAADLGVYTQEALTERYKKVRRICKRVAMVDETGSGLFQYLLSFLQSFVVFSKVRAISDEDEIDPSALSTFVLLDNAAHSLERGDLEQAVKYINQLKGQPRRVATDWLNDARLLLETRQAAEALLSHASASGLGSLY